MTIPDSVTHIGSEAFACSGLTQITFNGDPEISDPGETLGYADDKKVTLFANGGTDKIITYLNAIDNGEDITASSGGFLR